MIRWIKSLLKKEKEIPWWQHDHRISLPDFIGDKYGHPGTELGEQPIVSQKVESSTIALPRWYPETGYVQPTEENKF